MATAEADLVEVRHMEKVGVSVELEVQVGEPLALALTDGLGL